MFEISVIPPRLNYKIFQAIWHISPLRALSTSPVSSLVLYTLVILIEWWVYSHTHIHTHTFCLCNTTYMVSFLERLSSLYPLINLCSFLKPCHVSSSHSSCFSPVHSVNSSSLCLVRGPSTDSILPGSPCIIILLSSCPLCLLGCKPLEGRDRDCQSLHQLKCFQYLPRGGCSYNNCWHEKRKTVLSVKDLGWERSLPQPRLYRAPVFMKLCAECSSAQIAQILLLTSKNVFII